MLKYSAPLIWKSSTGPCVFIVFHLQFSKTVSLKFIILLSSISCRSSKYRFSIRYPQCKSVGIPQTIRVIRQFTSLKTQALGSITVATKSSNLTLLTAVTNQWLQLVQLLCTTPGGSRAFPETRSTSAICLEVKRAVLVMQVWWQPSCLATRAATCECSALDKSRLWCARFIYVGSIYENSVPA